jgi:signal transduction histidine kinase/ActR/RegA family two-component response regulator
MRAWWNLEGARWVGLALVCLGHAIPARGGDPATALSQPALETITRAEAFYSLPAASVARGLPVRLTAVVTYVDPEWRTLLVQDSSQGIHLVAGPESQGLALGQEVEVTGLTGLVGAEYRILDWRIRPMGKGALPKAPTVDVASIASRAERLDFVEVKQRVAWAAMIDGRLHFALGSGTNHVLARVLPPNRLKPGPLVDAVVSVRGVLSTMRDIRTPGIGSQLSVPGDAFVRILTPQAADPYAAAPQSIRALETARRLPPGTRCRVQGFVLDQNPGVSLTVQDHTGGIEVQSSVPDRFSLGQPVDLAGYPEYRGQRLVLREAVIRPALTLPAEAPQSAAAPEAAPAAPAQVLTNLVSVCALAPRVAALGYPVKVRALVTRRIAQWNSVFVADDTGSIYVDGANGDAAFSRLQAGDQFDLEAVTRAGSLKPVLHRPRVRDVRSGQPLPRALKARGTQLYEAAFDCERVDVEGILVAALPGNDVQLRLDDNGAIFSAYVPGEGVPTNLIGSVVRLQGVSAGRFDEAGRILEISIWLNSREDLQVVQSADADPEALERVVGGDVRFFERTQRVNRRVRAEGVVVQTVPGKYVHLETGERGMRVELSDPLELKRGDRVEAVGRLGAAPGGFLIRKALVRRLGSGPAPAPRRLPADRMLDPGCDQRFVQVEARLVGRSRGAYEQTLTLQSAGWVFQAVGVRAPRLPGVGDLREGSTVRVSGVYTLRSEPSQGPPSFRIAFESDGDIQLIRAAPWWTWRHSAAAGGAMGLALLGALVWAGQLRRLVRKQTAVIHERLEKESVLRAQLVQAQKMESVGRLAGGVAHDFNNMLQTILGNADLALDQAPAESRLREDLLEIRHAARRSAELTRQLLTFARKQTIHPQRLELNAVVEGALKMLKRVIGEGIELSWRPQAGLWPVILDPSQVEQVVTNLVVNARDAIRGPGTITLQTAHATLDRAAARLHAEAEPGDYVVLEVRDTGCGLSAETQAHLFEPFFTTKAVGKGTGLGLATVYGIVKQNRGFIALESSPGQGTVFRIHLPRAPDGHAASAPVSPPVEAPRGNETILLVEDEPQVLTLAERCLAGLGYRVLAACGPEAALRQAQEHAGPIDLLVTDVVMPGMSGPGLHERLTVTRPGLRVLFVSGYPADTFAHQGILAADFLFVQKPFTAPSLGLRVRETLDAASASGTAGNAPAGVRGS